MNDQQPLRLQVYMARSGIGSRRSNEKRILDGDVTVNGEIVTELGTKVTSKDDVRVGGARISPEQRHVYIALNKPPQYLCSNRDPQGRRLAVSLVDQDFQERLYSVGRLDYLSSGLVFFTNDGDFARIVTHPSTEVEKEYRVETQQEIPEEMLREYQAGVVIDGESLKLRSYRYKTPRSAQITLAQGKNREIRRVFASWKITIKKLHRIRIGIVKLEQLPPGQYRPLSQKEVSWFRSQAKTTAGRGARNRGTRR